MKLSQNENANLIDYEKYVSMNVICKTKVWTKVFKQTKQIIETNETNEMQTNLRKLHVQRKIWKGHNQNAICWVFCV
jgi:hypothetical protein